MPRKTGVVLICCLLATIATFTSASGRVPAAAGERSDTGPRLGLAVPAYCIAAHRVNKLEIAMANNGTFGNGFYLESLTDFFTGEPVPSCEFPAGSGVNYLYSGALWFGAVVDGDTLVSTGADGWQAVFEFQPDQAPFGDMIRRSTLDPGSPEYAGAKSQEDFIATYTDTFVVEAGYDPIDGPHRPLNIEVTRTSYAWSYMYAEDFVILTYQIKNIGQSVLENAYFGLYVDGDVCADCPMGGYEDDITGFVGEAPVTYGECVFDETQNLAWIADNDGDLTAPPGQQTPNVTGAALIQSPIYEPAVNYNWWVSNGNPIYDFGPRHVGTPTDPFRDFGTGGRGTPEGDANKYYMLRHPEVDYDQVETVWRMVMDSNWVKPIAYVAVDVTNGADTRYLLSVGPVTVAPGQTLPVAWTYTAGEGFHKVPDNLHNLPGDPQAFTANLDFNNLLTNSRLARWIYDNPGVDTDSDGFAGFFHVCNHDSVLIDDVWVYNVADTIWYTGDGMPDLRAATPPPAPVTWVEPIQNGLHIRFNGLTSEETVDAISRLKDFEGYHVYFGLTEFPNNLWLFDSWDRNDYIKYVWDTWAQVWTPDRRGYPYTLQELRCAYGVVPDPCWDPLFDPNAYDASSPLVHGDSLIFFVPVDLNHSEFGVQTKIMKTYPDQPYPSTLDPAQADPWELTPDGYFKYFEYFIDIPNLQADQGYCVRVTAFDFGTTLWAAPPLESNSELQCAVPLSGDITPTYEWINVYCSYAFLNGMLLPSGTVIEAVDPDGIVCGRDTVRADGSYGFMPVYRDDPYSEADEGAEPGDTISFRVNGEEVTSTPTVIWTTNGAEYRVCQFTNCQTIHLTTGWNLISWNRHLVLDIDEFMVLLAGCDVDVILGFNGGAQTYDPQLPQFSTLDVAYYTQGYWVKVNSDCDVDFCGSPILHDEYIHISTGWNLISYWPEDPMPIEDALAPIYDRLEVALGFNGTGLVYLPGDPTHSTFDTMSKGRGYWVKSAAAGLLYYPGWMPSPNPPAASLVANELDITPSRDWMSMYGAGLTLDGKPLAEGTVIEAYSNAGSLCGSGTYTNGVLKFTPVYGRDAQIDESRTYPSVGDDVQLRIGGQPVSPGLTFEGNGARAVINSLTSGTNLPTSFRLSQNYPNPFNPTTEISFDLPAMAQVRLEVFNVMGQRVTVLVDEKLEAGTHTVAFDGDRLASGIYLYRIQAGAFTESRKMLLLK